MKERPILFSAPMVRALLDGSKTQTRRVVKLLLPGDKHYIFAASDTEWIAKRAAQCPYGQPGDRLRVKENAWMWCEIKQDGLTKTGKIKIRYEPMRKAPIHYHADHPHKPLTTIVSPDGKWGWRMKVGRFLPSWASRITLEIVNVRVERLQDISADDAIAEGLKGITMDWRLVKYGIPDADGYPGTDDIGWPWEDWRISPVDAYRRLWESINGSGSWDANPWVWVIEFRRIV